MLRLTLAAVAVFLVIWLIASLRRGASATRRSPPPLQASINTLEPVQPSKSQSRPGRRTILVAAAGAFLSLFMNWVDFLWIERTGLRLGMAALAFAWIYPVVTARYSWRIHKTISKVCAATSVLAGLVVLANTYQREVFFFNVNVVGPGVIVYLCCAVLFSIGVFRYAKATPPGRKAQL